MKATYWAWGAILADLGLFVGPLPMAHSLAAFMAVWSLHACSCAILATATYALLPSRYRSPLWSVWLLMFGFSFIAPVIGSIGMLFVAHTALHRDTPQALQATPLSLALPEYDVQSKESNRAGQGAIRMRLATNVPANIRMQSLLTLQAVPNRVANPILENLLGDETDDVRLVAFGMLDAGEKLVTNLIRQERSNLEQKQTVEQRHICLRHLAELHWELIYASLAQGELRKHMLDEARRYADEAIACAGKTDAGLLFLRGRILLAQSEIDEAGVDEAEDSIRNAVACGLSEASALPYLAEMAFRNRRFDVVHGIMQRLSGLEVTSRTQAVVTLWTGHADSGVYAHLTPRAQAIVDLWTGRDSVTNYSDRRILHHL